MDACALLTKEEIETVQGSPITITRATAQTLTLKLFSVSDGTNTGDVSIPMSVLLGDTNANGVVNAADISQTKSQSGQSVGPRISARM